MFAYVSGRLHSTRSPRDGLAQVVTRDGDSAEGARAWSPQVRSRDEAEGAKAWSVPSWQYFPALGACCTLEGTSSWNHAINAHPQKVDGAPYWPEYWGITWAQCKEYLENLLEDVKKGQFDASLNVYELVERKVKPMTKGTGLSYALFVNKNRPKKVNVMVSHAWSENAIEFLETICRSCTETDVIFICAFSLYQCEDACGPSIGQQLGSEPEESPFQRVLQHIADEGSHDKVSEFWYRWRSTVAVLCDLIGIGTLCMLYTPPVLDGVVYSFDRSAVKKQYCPSGLCTEHWTWETIWPLYRICLPTSIVLFMLWVAISAVLTFTPMYRGRMIVVPNRGTDLYDRLWCVYEIYQARRLRVPCELGNTMASAGTSSCRNATCANIADQKKIQEEIVREMGDSGYDKIDDAISRLKKELEFGVFRLVCIWGFPIIVSGLAFYNMYDPHRCRLEFWGDTSGMVLVVGGLVYTYYRLFKLAQGVSPARHLCVLALAQFACFVVFEILREFSNSRKATTCVPVRSQSYKKLFFAFVFGFSKAARMGLLQSFTCSLIILGFTYFNRTKRAFHRTGLQLFGFALCSALFCFLRATEFGNKHIPVQNWSDMTQAYPEAFFIVTECAAVLVFPWYGIWGASLWWGLTVDWEDFWNKSVSKGGTTYSYSSLTYDPESDVEAYKS